MELSEANRKLIEEEEAYRKQLRAEEDYRAQLREQTGSNAIPQPKKKGMGCLGWFLIIFFGIPILTVVVITAINPSKQIDQAKKAVETSQNGGSQKENRIPYELKSNGTVDFIIIDPKYVNTNDLTTLGQELRDNYKDTGFIRISIYDDMKAVEMRDRVINDQATQKETAFYDNHYIAQYNKNSNTGYNQFAIYREGSNQAVNKVINY